MNGLQIEGKSKLSHFIGQLGLVLENWLDGFNAFIELDGDVELEIDGWRTMDVTKRKCS